MTLNKTEKESLLKTARSSIESHFDRIGAGRTYAPQTDGALSENRGAFVSLYMGRALRGCIGLLTSGKPLHETVAEMAFSAAFHDTRFMPIEKTELDRLRMEITVLSPLTPMLDPEGIEIGVHGIYIVKGKNSGVLLPQVAASHGFDKHEFLDQTCLKAGLAPGAWKKGAMVFLFKAEVFSENPK
ncbi:MAG: AmmeMemoRadiSam system protein A [Deltaproteobacteria bacterium]|nr:AmmeMemoRadiSam system protein A [Deltaproteobacteria bacterium]